jgi:hypothetical protein
MAAGQPVPADLDTRMGDEGCPLFTIHRLAAPPQPTFRASQPISLRLRIGSVLTQLDGHTTAAKMRLTDSKENIDCKYCSLGLFLKCPTAGYFRTARCFLYQYQIP